MQHKKEDKLKFLEVLKNKNYHIGKACKAFKISRGTYYLWISEDWFKEEIRYLKEEDIDDSEESLRILRRGMPKRNKEGALIGWLIKPEATAVIFHLKTQAKDRGYIEKTETENTTTHKGSIDISKWLNEDKPD